MLVFSSNMLDDNLNKKKTESKCSLQVTICSEEYLFLGSRLGNSLLLRFTEKDHSTVITIDDTDQNEKEKEKGINRIDARSSMENLNPNSVYFR